MGAGKSTLGAMLAQGLGWTFVDLDEEIVRSEQKSIADIFASTGESGFRELERLALSVALQRERVVLALGGGAIETAANRQLLQEERSTLLLYLEAPLQALLERCEQQQQSKDAVKRPVLEQRAELLQRFQRRKPLYESAHWIVHTSGRTPEEITAAILQHWNQAQWK